MAELSRSRERLLTLLGEVARHHPEVRVGQIVCIAIWRGGQTDDIFFTSDEELMRGLEMMKEEDRDKVG